MDDLEQAFVAAGRRRKRVVAIVAALVSLAAGVLVVCIAASPSATPRGYGSSISPVVRAIEYGLFVVFMASIVVWRIYRDQRLLTIGEGTSEILRVVIGRHVLGGFVGN